MKQRIPWTPELRAKLKAHQLTMIETWFGFMLAKLEIPRRFFPWHWCFRFKDNDSF
jgi:hypothetical protein